MPNEGDIVRNKRTGETAVWRNGRPEPMGGATPAMSAPVGNPDPIIRPADPYRPAQEARAQQDQALQIRSAERAEEQFAITQAREEKRDERQAAKDQMGGVEQGKASGFLERAINAEKSYGALGKVDARSLPGQAVKDNFPNVANYMAGPGRQQADQAEREFIAAILRYDSGAAIPDNEYVTNGQIYFPRPGDTPQVIAQKAKSRAVAIRSLLGASGPRGSQFAAEIEALEQAATRPASGEGETLPEVDDDSLAVTVTDDSPTPPTGAGPTNGNSPGYQQIAAGVGDLVEGGFNNTLGLIGNPLNATINAATGSNLSTNLGQTLRDAMGLPEGDPRIAAVTQTAAGGFGMGAAARYAGGLASGATQNALLQFGASPLRDAATGAGAGATGQAAASMGAGPGGQALASLAGGFGANALVGAPKAFSNAGRPPPDFDPTIVDAGARQGIPIRRPDAAPSLRGEMANVAQSPHGGPIVNTARNADREAVEGRIRQVGGNGRVRDDFSLGRTVQGAAERQIARTRQQANGLYNRARTLAGNTQVTARNADAVLDRNIQELRAAGENTNAGAIRYLEGLRGDIDRGLSVDAVQNLRTNMRGQINERSLTGTDTERRVGQVIDAMNQDLADQLPAGAAQALRAADDFYRGRMEFIKQVGARFVGSANNPISAETAAQRLRSMVNGKGDASRFTRMWRELEPAEQEDLTATIAASLGRKANGEFSMETLIRSLDPQKGINPRLARIVFGSDGARALADLRTIAVAKTRTQQGMNNSNTGATVTRAAGGLKTLILGAFGYSAGGPVGAVAGAMSRDVISKIGEQRAARLLLNPDFTRWLRNAPPATNPRAINGYFARLNEVAAKSSVFAGDAKALQDALQKSFAQSPVRAAASEKEQD